MFKWIGVHSQGHLGEELDEAAVGVEREAAVAHLAGEGFDSLIVQAEVEDCVHHPRHRELRAGADGDQERVGRVAEAAADRLFHFAQVGAHVFPETGRGLAVVLVVVLAGLCGDGETGGDGKVKARHLGEVGAFATQELAHLGAALREPVDVLHSSSHSAASGGDRQVI